MASCSKPSLNSSKSMMRRRTQTTSMRTVMPRARLPKSGESLYLNKLISSRGRFLACALIAILFAAERSAAQTIQVDVTPEHATNHFRPNKTLGAGIDRIPPEAIDSGLSKPNLDRALASGWQPVSYRNNTELSIEAWHWNPQGA